MSNQTLLPRRGFLATTALAGSAALFSIGRARAKPVSQITIDYAYYSPLSLLLKQNGWVEQALGPNISVSWVLSQGSNKALEFLRGRSIVLGSAAGSATLLARANGEPVQTVYVNDIAETTALVTQAGSSVHSVSDLKGRRVAATPGTEPYAFLLRALENANLRLSDITLVPLQHELGRMALDRGDVDAWAGLDPFMAEAQLQNKDRLFYRNLSIITPNVLVAREDFLHEHPGIITKLLQAYERARRTAQKDPQVLAPILAQAAGLSANVAKLQMSRQHFDTPELTPDGQARIAASGRVFQKLGVIPASVNIDATVAAMVNNQFVTRVENV
ncbi:MAG TPA: aliphatic sulfonate ABC transporter substrate-binding protein [Acidocella sp.]|nr:aliphatic sulfonate ABC transporter substrate-binding protein [Acidocella sp.]